MADRFDGFGAPPRHGTDVGRDTTSFDAGLRKHMLAVYNYMASGVLLTGILAVAVAYTSLLGLFVNVTPGGQIRGLNILGWVVTLAPVGIALWLSFGFNRISTGTAKVLFWAYAALMGLSLSVVVAGYTASSVAGAFFASAAGFGALSLYGYTTKRDLGPIGAFLIVGLIGLIVAMLIATFTGGMAGPFGTVISLIGVLIFAGLTAWHTQLAKNEYYQFGGTDMHQKITVLAALRLYVDFINMFLFLLRLFGDRR